MAATRDIRFQSVVHAGLVIKAHGEGQSPVISFGQPGAASRGAVTTVFQFNPNLPATMVYSMRREEEAFEQLLQIYLSQTNDRPRPKAGGIAKDSSDTDLIRQVAWEDSMISAIPDMSFGYVSDIVTWTFELQGVTIK